MDKQAVTPRANGAMGLVWALVAAGVILLGVRELRAGESVRFAVVAGNNVGLPSADPLRYAERDASRMAHILEDIGGVSSERMFVLQGKGPDDLRHALDEVAARAQKLSGDTVLVFYYSGHADSGWLRMGGRGISVTEVRKRLELMPTKVRIAIVDACQSGAITRAKGGKVISPFMEERPVNVEGLVILTSASAAEPAQESDILKSSFFSHHLMSGLRGPADSTGDGTVSALEAYQYSYRFTVAETEGTSGGTQHPTFLYALEGQGEIALTAVRDGRARVELPTEIDGTILFLGDGGRIEAEVVKSRHEKTTVALVPGNYEVRWRDARHLRAAELTLADGEVRVMGAALFDARRLEKSALKGTAETSENVGAEPPPLDDTPLGGGVGWAGSDAAQIVDPAWLSKRDRKQMHPLSKREGARLHPAAAAAVSTAVPGLAHFVERRYAHTTLLTGLIALSTAGAAILGSHVEVGENDTVQGAKYIGTWVLGFTAVYAYGYTIIDAFYYNTRGGPGAPSPLEDAVEIQFGAAPLLSRSIEGLKCGTTYGLGVGVPLHEHFVLGLRDLSVYPNPGITSLAFSPEARLRGLFAERLGWSASVGILMQVHIETEAVANRNKDSGFSAMPYIAGALHYFPGRAWSLDFGLRSGMNLGTRRALGDIAQASLTFSVEYLGGLTWHH